MSADTLFFQVKTIGLSKTKGRKPQTLLKAAMHNRRMIQAELGAKGDIDPQRTRLNQTLAGPASPADVVALAKSLMESVGHVPQRRDYTQAYELVFSLPVATPIDTDKFFRHCLEWVAEHFGQGVVLSADIHVDQAQPHMHVLISPIAEGRYKGSNLITRMELHNLRKSFAMLALEFGLVEPVRRLRGALKETVIKLVMDHLHAHHDPILQSAIWPLAERDIKFNPGRYATNLGIPVEDAPPKVKKVKTLAELAVSPGKGPKFERKSNPIVIALLDIETDPNPIGIEKVKVTPQSNPIEIESSPVTVGSKHLTHSSVLGSISAVPLFRPAQAAKTPACHGNYRRLTSKPVGLFTSLCLSATQSISGADLSHLTTTRVQDDEHSAGAWDAERGEFSDVEIPTTNAWAANQFAAIRTKTGVSSVPMVSGDRFVERDVDVSNQSEISEGEVQAWH